MSSSTLAVSVECRPVREIHPDQGDDSISIAIVEAIGELEDVEPTALTPLNEIVDTDAIESLIKKGRDGGQTSLAVCFEYHGWNVFVRGDGSILIGVPSEFGKNTPLF
jgi:hypothetical protein